MRNGSQLFIALCAAALGAETYRISGNTINFSILLILFFSTLFIYNAAKMSLSIFDNTGTGENTFQVQGNTISVVTCMVSIIILFGLLTACNWIQILIFILTSVLSLCYMMPFKKNGIPIKGLRNNLALKNIILSLTWASATVLFPLSQDAHYLTINEIIFMFCRRFFFIYALTVIYDLRDLAADKKAGMQTIALRFGEPATKLLSLIALAFFLFFTFTDPSLALEENKPLIAALLASAVFAAIISLNTHNLRKKSYYSFVVDSAMAMQFLFVFLFRYV